MANASKVITLKKYFGVDAFIWPTTLAASKYLSCCCQKSFMSANDYSKTNAFKVITISPKCCTETFVGRKLQACCWPVFKKNLYIKVRTHYKKVPATPKVTLDGLDQQLTPNRCEILSICSMKSVWFFAGVWGLWRFIHTYAVRITKTQIPNSATTYAAFLRVFLEIILIFLLIKNEHQTGAQILKFKLSFSKRPKLFARGIDSPKRKGGDISRPMAALRKSQGATVWAVSLLGKG